MKTRFAYWQLVIFPFDKGVQQLENVYALSATFEKIKNCETTVTQFYFTTMLPSRTLIANCILIHMSIFCIP